MSAGWMKGRIHHGKAHGGAGQSDQKADRLVLCSAFLGWAPGKTPPLGLSWAKHHITLLQSTMWHMRGCLSSVRGSVCSRSRKFLICSILPAFFLGKQSLWKLIQQQDVTCQVNPYNSWLSYQSNSQFAYVPNTHTSSYSRTEGDINNTADTPARILWSDWNSQALCLQALLLHSLKVKTENLRVVS